MAGSDNELSIIDLIEYYEPGPVLKERTPNLNRTSFYPGDGEHHAEDGEPEPGKKVTKKARLDIIRKKALGLTDVPRAAIPGNEGYLGRRDPGTEEGQEEFTTWFGGQEDFVLDNLEKEDKLPTNKKRNENKPESGDLNKMSFEKSELLKLAKALSVRGQVSASDSVIRLTKQADTNSGSNSAFFDGWEELTRGAGQSLRSLTTWGGGYLPKNALKERIADMWVTYGGELRFVDQSGVEKTLEALIEFWISQDLKFGRGGEPNDTDKARVKTFLDGKKSTEITVEGLIGVMWNDGESGYKTGIGQAQTSFTDMVQDETKTFVDAWNSVIRYKQKQGTGTSTGQPVAGTTQSLPGGTSAAKEEPWVPVQKRINELFADGGALQSRRPDPWEPLATDGDMGEKSTTAYNAATGSNYDPNARPWPIPKALTPEQALDELNAQIEEVVAPTPSEPADTTRGGGPGEVAPEESPIAEGKATGDLQDWYIADSDDGSHYVGIGKEGTEYAYQIFAISKEPNESGRHDAVRITDRGDDPRFTGARFLEGKEDGRLISQIRRDRLGRAQRTRYTDVIRGQRKSVKGDTRRGRRRGAERAERAAAGTRRRDLRQRGRSERRRR